jgi:hypothetical protein
MPQKGQIESLPVLTYNRSSTTNGDNVEKWMKAMKSYTIANYIKDLDEIFNKDNPHYPTIEAPDPLERDDRKDLMLVEIWKHDMKDFRTNSKKLIEDSTKLFGVILGQMSISSIEQVGSTQEGKNAIDGKDPLALVEAITSTHITGGRIDANQNLYVAETAYRNIVMYEHEKLHEYHRRFLVSINALTECALRANKEESVPKDELQIIHFINNLNANYGLYKEYFIRGMLPAPKATTVTEAYEKITVFGSDRSEFGRKEHGQHSRNIFHTTSGRASRGGRSGRGRGRSGRPTNAMEGACYNCGEKGHYANKCPHSKSSSSTSIVNAVTEVQESKKARKN